MPEIIARRSVRERVMDAQTFLGKREMAASRPVRRQLARRVDVEEVIRQVAVGERELDRRWPDYRDAYALTISERDLYARKTGSTEPVIDVYNSTGALALRQGVSNTLQTLMPSESEWIRFEAGGRVPREAQEAYNRQLEPWTEVFFNYLSASNHASECQEAGIDLMLGLGPIVLNPGTYEDPLQFSAVPLSQVVPIKGPTGMIETVHRPREMAVGHIPRQYPVTIEQLPSEWREAYRKDKDTPVKVIDSTIYQPATGDYVRCLIDPGKKLVLWARVEETSGWIMPEWQRVAGCMFSRGPLLDVLPDLRSLNQIEFDTMIAAQLRGRPPLEVSSYDPRNPFAIRLTPGALNYNSLQPGVSSITPMNLGAEPTFGQFSIERMERRIERGLLAENFLPEPGQGGVISATEVQIRRIESIRRSGGNFGRLQGTWLTQTARRAVPILASFNLFPKLKVDNRQVKLRYAGPLQQAQEAGNVQAAHAWARDVRDTVGNEAFVATVAVEKFADYTGRKAGIPSELVRTPEEVAFMQQKGAELAGQGVQLA